MEFKQFWLFTFYTILLEQYMYDMVNNLNHLYS